MGNETSTQTAIDQAEEEYATPEQIGTTGRGIRLYKFTKAGDNPRGQWVQVSRRAQPDFYDTNQDTSSEKPRWSLEISAGDVDEELADEANWKMNDADRRITFKTRGELWALKFPDEDSYTSFKDKLRAKLFWNVHGVDNDAEGLKEVYGEYAEVFYDPEPMEEEPPAQNGEEDRGDEEEEFAADEVKETAKEREGEAIRGMVMGALDNAYLVRDTKIDVLRNVEGGVDDADLCINMTPSKGTAPFTPSRVLLADRETKMNMLSPYDCNKLFHCDIEHERVVSEFSFTKDGVDIPIQEIATEDKAAQMDPGRSTFLALDSNRLCRFDLRDPRGVVAGSPLLTYEDGKDFSRGTNFTCMATSGDGHIVVGSMDGKVRLYSNKSMKQAKTSFPSFGKAITSVDVTFDSHYVLATTDKYILVFDTSYVDPKKQTRTTGFVSKMGRGNAKPPKMLQLKPEDEMLIGDKPFRNAKFTWITEQGKRERWVVASCGPYSVVWNWAKIRTAKAGLASNGGLQIITEYLLSEKDADVVDSAFMHDRYNPVVDGQIHDSLVVTTPHKIFTIAS